MPKQLAKAMLVCLLTAGGGYQTVYAQQAVSANQTSGACTGTVVDSEGEPVVGASVLVVGTTKGASTNIDGHFSFTGVKPGAKVRISSIGFETVEVIWNGQPLSVVLKDTSSDLDEVVVVGYGVQKKVNLTGAVAAVNGDVIANRPVTNVGQALQGVVGNLIVSPGSGAPGQGASFNVRGVTSISGNSASQGGPLVLVDNVQMDPNLVNPDDIESISVLKDGASAAIYGARAAYGVILITTKKGKAGEKPVINFSATGYWAKSALEFHKVNSLDYINLYDEASINGGGSAEYTGLRRQMIEDFYYGRRNDPTYIDPASTDGKYAYCGNTDWWDALYKTSFNQNYNVSISGGTDKTTYYASLGLFDQGTNRVGANEDYKRWNAKVAVNTQLTPWLNVGANITNSYISQSHPTGSANSGVTSMGGMFKNDLSPLMPVRHPDGNYAGQGSYTNPIAMAELGGTSKYKYNDLWLSGVVKITPMKGLMFQADYTWNFYSYNIRNHNTSFMEYGQPGGYALPYVWSSPTGVQYQNANDYYTSFNAFGQYDWSINSKHNFSVMVGYNQERKINNSFWAKRQDMITNELLMLSQGTGQLTANSGGTQWAINSVFGRINYDFMGKYLVEFTGRYDGTSKFPKGDRYGFFPSGSIGWRVSEESFWEPIRSWWNNFKIRASYGRLGNQAVSGNFPYLLTYGLNPEFGYLINGNKVISVTPPGLVSASLTWEKVDQVDVGFDVSFLQNRLVADFDWFSRETKGALTTGTPLPNTLGTSVPQANAANIRTNGWELSVSWNDRINSIGLGYYARLSLSDNWATVTKFDNPNPEDINLGYLYEGKRIGEIWGFESNGLFQSEEEIKNHADQSYIYGGTWYPGDVKYEDINGDGKIDDGEWTLKDPGDNKVIGNDQPRYMFGITVGAEWKGIDFEMFWQGVGKRDLFGSSVGEFWAFPNKWQTPLATSMDRWTEDNRGAYFPRTYLGNNGRNQQTSTRYLLSAAYGRLKNIVLGYTLPQNITGRIGIQKVRFFVQGENLLTISPLKKYADPETVNKMTYPIQKKYSIGVNITL
jgi:TonB-linked SusC/RagA family outer membrane protein